MNGAREERRDLNRIQIAIAAGGASDPRGEKIEGNGGVTGILLRGRRGGSWRGPSP
jgi:hypothetical protein